MEALEVAWRPTKPRTIGLTVVNDRGIGCRAWEDAIDMAGDYIDVVKLGIGTAYVMQNLEQKVSLLRSAHIDVVLGGTLFETYWSQGQVKAYRQLAQELGLNWVEISSGSYDIPIAERVQLVREFSQAFRVMAEVGAKDPERQPSPELLALEATQLRQAGAEKIILEGRGSGTGGIFNHKGVADERTLSTVLSRIALDDLMFEAPQESQQIAFIRRFGPNVNLANIPFDDILMLEAQRLGLRYDTQLVGRTV